MSLLKLSQLLFLYSHISFLLPVGHFPELKGEDLNLLFCAVISLRLIRRHAHVQVPEVGRRSSATSHPLLPAAFWSRHNGATSKKRKLLPQAHSRLPFIVFNKASLLIQRGKRERSAEKRKKKKGRGWLWVRERGEQKGKSKQFWVSSHFSLRTEVWRGEKKSIMSTPEYYFEHPASHPLAGRPLENQITQQTYRLL